MTSYPFEISVCPHSSQCSLASAVPDTYITVVALREGAGTLPLPLHLAIYIVFIIIIYFFNAEESKRMRPSI